MSDIFKQVITFCHKAFHSVSVPAKHFLLWFVGQKKTAQWLTLVLASM